MCFLEVYQIVRETLEYWKLCVRWIPHPLTDAQKDTQFYYALASLKHYQ